MMYTIRNAGRRTKEMLNRFADEHNLTIAEALDQLVELGLERYEQQRKSGKKFSSTQEAMNCLPPW
ncbi:MAG: hypothetical protein AB1529_03425 [Candidatus Micrarchaeota archaeon]